MKMLAHLARHNGPREILVRNQRLCEGDALDEVVLVLLQNLTP